MKKPSSLTTLPEENFLPGLVMVAKVFAVWTIGVVIVCAIGFLILWLAA